VLHQILRKYGIYYAKARYMAAGIDWLWDLRRAGVGVTPVVFDVGANEGQTTTGVLETFPRATVHAFEPVRRTFELLQRNVAANGGVHCNHLAVSDTSAPVQMLSSSNSQLSRAASPSEVASGDRTLEGVEGTTVDAYCAQRGIRAIDVLKTDTEGFDVRVLKGAEGLLRAKAVRWVLAEVTFDPTDRSHSQFSEIEPWLTGRGMEIYAFYDAYHVDERRHLLFCNALFTQRA
jgi:FkbM family methyltransferase